MSSEYQNRETKSLKTKTVENSKRKTMEKQYDKNGTHCDVLYEIEDERVKDDPEGYFIN